ncbi:MAG: serine/threonine-protein phosphatase [Armatimonadetes bacterium]|nr:serine/threonine-protein phosphatase [Armatimonadota bacterium]MDE2206635.1 serine/threonine-protein phosphatase [Armatimonadota bacterium]
MTDRTARIDRAELVLGWRAYADVGAETKVVVKVAARTDMGRVRENNEDKFEWYEPEEPGVVAARGSLFAVADGVGGANAGQIASETALSMLITGYYNSELEDVDGALNEAIQAASDRIYAMARLLPSRSGMATTLTAAVIVGGDVVIAQVGDSRAYLVRNGDIRQVSLDHSWVEEQVRSGALTRADAEMSPFRNVITRSVGSAPTTRVDFFWEEARAGDIWLLCSDGLSGCVSDNEICATVEACSPAEAVRRLIVLANARGGPDNVTAMVVSVREVLRDGLEAGAAAADSERDGQGSLRRRSSAWSRLFGT